MSKTSCLTASRIESLETSKSKLLEDLKELIGKTNFDKECPINSNQEFMYQSGKLKGIEDALKLVEERLILM